MKHPLVTIVIPVLNRTLFLKEALLSVTNQSYNNLQIIVSDNGSDVDIESFLAFYLQNDSRIFYRRNKESLSMAEHFNQCLCLSKGKYFMILSDDDLISENFIELLVNRFDSCSTVTIGITSSIIIDGKSQHSSISSPPDWEKINGIQVIKNLLYRNEPFPVPTFVSLFTRTDLFKSIGGFPVFEKGGYSDTAAAINLLLKGDVVFETKAILYYRVYIESYGLSMQYKSLATCGNQFIDYYKRMNDLCFNEIGLSKKDLILLVKKISFECYYNRLNLNYGIYGIKKIQALFHYGLGFYETVFLLKIQLLKTQKRVLRKFQKN